MRRSLLLGPALAAGLAIPLALSAPASAAAGGTVVRSGSSVNHLAASGFANNVSFTVSGTLLTVTDSAGLTAGPGCTQVNATTATCGAAGGVTRLTATLGDGDDTADSASLAIGSDFNGGTGNDRLVGGAASDRLTDPDGWTSAPAGVTFAGNGGTDFINANNDHFDAISCGTGTDYATADSLALDPAAGCEFLGRS